MTDGRNVGTLLICAVICIFLGYTATAACLIGVGVTETKETEVVNATISNLGTCHYRCYDLGEFGDSCILTFDCYLTWNYMNETYFANSGENRWDTKTDNCTSIVVNGTLAAVIRKYKPANLVDVQPYPYEYESSLQTTGTTMFVILAFIAIPTFLMSIWEICCKKRSGYNSV